MKQDQFTLTRFDYFVAPAIAILAGIGVFSYVGNAITWDELLYMNISQYTTPQAWILNRYGHVYLQKFFFWIAGDCLTGGKIYWCFLFFSSCVLVYWCARMLAGKKKYIIGLVAALFFCSSKFFAVTAGCTYADFTVMFLMTLGIFIYLAFIAGRRKHRNLFVMVLGLIFFWAIKSKETGICMVVLFFGLGEDETGNRCLRWFVRDIRWLLLGIAGGFVLLMMLDYIFMNDAWFSVRPSNIIALLSFNAGVYPHDKTGISVYRVLSSDPILAAFVLCLLVGWNDFGRNLSRHEKITWLIPFLLILFVVAISIPLRCDTIIRYLVPGIPVICMWASQCFRLNFISRDVKGISGPEDSMSQMGTLFTKKLIGYLLVLFALIIVLFIMPRTLDLIANFGWNSLDRFYICVILPLATTTLIICQAVLRKKQAITLFLMSLCLFFIVYFPLTNNFSSLKKREVAKRSANRFEPYRVFADELRFGKDVKIMVSKGIYSRFRMLGRNRESTCWMFNVFYNERFDYDQFIYGNSGEVLNCDYSYAFITWQEWEKIREKHDVSQIMKNYTVKSDTKKQLALLSKL